MTRTVVLGYTPNKRGRAALAEAIEEVRRRNARLHVVNTSRGDAVADPTLAETGELDELHRTLAAAGVDHDVVQHVGLEPADDILDAARETGAELVVIGTRRRTPVGKLLMGSTAQRVLLEADCPVLAVKVSRG